MEFSATFRTDHCISLFVNLNRSPEVSDRDSHGAVFVNIPKEIPQAQFTAIKIILFKKSKEIVLRRNY